MGAFSSGFLKSADGAGGYLARAIEETHGQLNPFHGGGSGFGRVLGAASYIPDVYSAGKDVSTINDADDVAARKVRKLKQAYALNHQDSKTLRRGFSEQIKGEAKEDMSGIAGGIGLGAVGAGLLAAPFTGGLSIAAMIAGGMAGGYAGDKLGRKAYNVVTEKE